MKIRQFLVISDRYHREFADTVIKIARRYMEEESSNIISIIPVDTDNLIVSDIVSLGVIDGIIFCPYVKAGYVNRLISCLANNATDIVIATNAFGAYMDQLDLVLDGNKSDDMLRFKGDKFIMNIVSSQYNHTNINMKAYIKKPALSSKNPKSFGVLDHDVFVPCGQKINANIGEETLKAEADFQYDTWKQSDIETCYEISYGDVGYDISDPNIFMHPERYGTISVVKIK